MKTAARWAQVVVIAALILGCLVWIDHVRAKPDLKAFDPGDMGQMEAAMWRSYYEGRWLQLGWQSMWIARTQYGFSVLDSLQLAKHAAVAALWFRKNTDDPECLPELEAHHAIVRKAAGARFDPAEAAQLELEWWKQRRRSVPPEDYARTIAQLAALVYDVPRSQVLPASTRRANAMAYRDARRDGPMDDDEWRTIEQMLVGAYTPLKEAIIGGQKL